MPKFLDNYVQGSGSTVNLTTANYGLDRDVGSSMSNLEGFKVKIIHFTEDC